MKKKLQKNNYNKNIFNNNEIIQLKNKSKNNN